MSFCSLVSLRLHDQTWMKIYLYVQPNIADFKSGFLSDVYTHEVGRVFVQDVYLPQSEKKKFLPDGRGDRREERHGGGQRAWQRVEKCQARGPEPGWWAESVTIVSGGATVAVPLSNPWRSSGILTGDLALVDYFK